MKGREGGREGGIGIKEIKLLAILSDGAET